MIQKSFLHVLLLAVALMAGAAIGPPRIAEAQFIDRIVRPCTAGIVTLANVTVNPLGSGDIVVTTCTGGSLTVNGAAVIPGGVTCTGCTVGTLPYFSAANTLANSPITRIGANTASVQNLRLGTASSITGALILQNSASAFATTIFAGTPTAARSYAWPVDFGAAGTVLTDAAGNGVLSWTAPGACATCVTSAAALTSTAIVTGAGGQAAQTPSATTTLSSAGNLVLAGIQTIAVGATTSATTDLLINPTTKASGNLINAGVASNNAFTVDFAGAIRSGSLFVGNTSFMGSNSRGYFQFPSNGVVELTDNAGTSFNRLQLGGTTSSFPAIKRNGTGIDIRLADDSAYATLTAGQINVGNTNLISNGIDVQAASTFGASGGGTSRTTTFSAGGSAGGTYIFANAGLLQLGGSTSSFPAIKRNGTGIDFRLADDSAYANFNAFNITANAGISAVTYLTATNCADSAGAAACGSASAGAFVIDAGTTSTVVSTTSVTANSEIFVTFDASLGTRLSVTCNTTAALPYITARTAGTSFTVTVAAGPAVNPACYNYHIVN